MQLQKLPLSSLPLVAAGRRLTNNLTADPIARTPTEFLKVLRNTPSLQRRARLLDPSAHFSYVSPLPLPFPFRIEFPEGIEDKKEFIEAWLSHREATEVVDHERPTTKDVAPELRQYSSQERIQERELLAISQSCVDDCLPQLDIGDSLDLIGDPSLLAKPDEAPNNSSETISNDSKSSNALARQELVDILSGHTVLASFPPNATDEDRNGYAPWSLRYSGHQFGQWAGQLGDGRAISILELSIPNDTEKSVELQLKGAGRTPFSRSADGLAVVRSSIREFLCAEAMHALGVPTTRSLSLTYLPTLPVHREREERSAIATRVSPSFIRIGSFQALNPPEKMFFWGGGQQAEDLDALRVLGEYVSKHVLKLGLGQEEPWAEKLVMECAVRNARMVAGWQAFGFMHGVINTDNVSILGLTIDYGPYAFMDVYDSNHICNHSDGEGRYSFKSQPTMIIYALRKLLDSLSPIIGAEKKIGKAVAQNWNKDISEEELKEWTETGKSIGTAMDNKIMEEFTAHYVFLMRKRLGLRKNVSTDFTDFHQIITPLLELLEHQELDFHATLRALTRFRPRLLQPDAKGDLDTLLDELIVTTQCTRPEQLEISRDEWKRWLATFSNRINEDTTEWTELEGTEDWFDCRQRITEKSNPRFILRQWLLEEIISKVEADFVSGRRVLAKVLEMSVRPFDKWGGEGMNAEDLSEEAKEERRLCEQGDKKMLGFQCSCSS